MPNGTFDVSPCTMSIIFSSMPSIEAITCGNTVSCPCPWLWLPVKTEMLPVAFTRTVALS